VVDVERPTPLEGGYERLVDPAVDTDEPAPARSTGAEREPVQVDARRGELGAEETGQSLSSRRRPYFATTQVAKNAKNDTTMAEGITAPSPPALWVTMSGP
jgi:hypothetical protein